ncbi:T9SS type A sorting domain-containing protein [bacterium]|nr:T9SS type A sorting domain-containing protein [bacterium]
MKSVYKKQTIYILLFVLFLFSLVSAKNTFELIENARENGEITEAKAIELKALALKAPQELPENYIRTDLVKCATPYIYDLKREMENLPPQMRMKMAAYLERPTGFPETYDSDGGHFKIHYTLSGYNATTLDFVQRFAQYFEESWELLVDSMGYLEPSPDGLLGGDEKFDVYVRNLVWYYGVTYPEADGPYDWDDAFCYIEVENDYYDFPDNDDPEGPVIGAQKVTAVHEFFHAVQSAYDQWEELWWMEVSSVWIEDRAYPYVNDYLSYVGDYFSVPHIALFYDDIDHMYACGIFNHYLSHVYGDDTIRYIWEVCLEDGRDMPGALRTVFSWGFEDMFAGFTTWNFFTDTLSDSFHYPDGHRYPGVYIENTHSTYPVTDEEPRPSRMPQNMAANYIVFNNPGYTDNLTIKFTGDSRTNWIVPIIKFPVSGMYEIDEISLEFSDTGIIVIPGFENYRTIVMIPTTVGTAIYGTFDYTYSAIIGSELFPPPRFLSAEGSLDGRVPLLWHSPIIETPDSYNVYRRTSGASFAYIASSPETTFTDWSVTNGANYEYTVTALYGDTESGYSNIVSATPLAGGMTDTVEFSIDSGEPTSYSSYWDIGDMAMIKFQPEDTRNTYKLLTVSLCLYNFASVSSQPIKVKAYAVDTDNMPSYLLGASATINVTDFYPDWATIDVSDLDIHIPNERGIVFGFEYTGGTYRELPSILLDDNMDIPYYINFYYTETDSRWWEHYDFWDMPANSGYNMIRASLERVTAGIETAPSKIPQNFLITSYPNPFNSKTTIHLNTTIDQLYPDFSLAIYDITGKKVSDLNQQTEHSNASSLQFTWDGKDTRNNTLPSGVYFCVLNHGGKRESRKLLFLK